MNGLQTRKALRDAWIDQTPIERWQETVRSRDREICAWKVAVVALLGVILAQWWGK